MIRKRLSIIFFSVMMIAATPRVMNNFNGYANAFYQKAEREWLHFLLTFTQPAETEKTPTNPNQVVEPSTCALQPAKSEQPSTTKSKSGARKSARSVKSQNRNFDFEFKVAASPHVEMDWTSNAAVAQLEKAVRRHATRADTEGELPGAVVRDEKAKTEYLRVLLRSLKFGDRKVIRALEKEVAEAPKALSFSFVPVHVEVESVNVQTSEESPDVVECDTSYSRDSSDESTLDAR